MDALSIAQFALAQALALTLLHSLWQIALLAVLASLLLAACARRSAALRHSLGMGFLLAMVGVPALSFVHFVQRSALEINAGLLPAMPAPAPGATPGVYVQDSGTLAALLSLLWLAGVALMLLRFFGGWRLVGALERAPYELLPADWQQRVLALQRALGISRRVLVRLGEDIAAPFTARLLRPVIWLPLALIARLPVEQVEALVAHELAHIKRLDWLWNGLQCLAEALLFFHPGAWWLGRRIREEREHACDDLAVAACGNAIALAEALAALERHRHPFPRLVLAAHGGSLMQRITRLLTGATPGTRWRLPLGLLVLAGSGALLATQVGLSGNFLPDMHFESTTAGKLGPGDERIIRTRGLDKQRYYRAAVDRAGRLTEQYQEDGQSRPIDADTRKWINEMTRLAVAPPPPPPPPPPELSAPPAPPAPPPAPPAPPEMAESQAFQAIAQLVANDPHVRARLGSPIVVAPKPVSGHIDLDGNGGGDARLSFIARGPKGELQLSAQAVMAGQAWQLQSVDMARVPR